MMGNEFSCDLGTVTEVFDGLGALATAFCQEPGYEYPDLLTIGTNDDTRIQVNSLRFGINSPGTDDLLPGQILFTRCDSVKELSFD